MRDEKRKRAEYQRDIHRKDLSEAYTIHREITSQRNCLKLNDKMDVWQCIQNVLEIISLQNHPVLYLKLHSISELLLMQFKQFCSRQDETRLEVFICGNSTVGDLKSMKLKRLKEMLDLLVQKKRIIMIPWIWWGRQNKTGYRKESKNLGTGVYAMSVDGIDERNIAE